MAMARRPVVGMTKLSTAMRQRLWPVKEKPIATRKLKACMLPSEFLVYSSFMVFHPLSPYPLIAYPQSHTYLSACIQRIKRNLPSIFI
jgi:hypothetical protein